MFELICDLCKFTNWGKSKLDDILEKHFKEYFWNDKFGITNKI